jgi:hypothetical protein
VWFWKFILDVFEAGLRPGVEILDSINKILRCQWVSLWVFSSRLVMLRESWQGLAYPCDVFFHLERFENLGAQNYLLLDIGNTI